MIACCWIPRFVLAVLARHCDEQLPVAVQTTHDARATVLECNDAARALGVRPGMATSRALGFASDLQLLEYDEARIDEAAGRFVEQLEGMGALVEPVRPGRAVFDAGELVELYGGLEQVGAKVHAALPAGLGARVGMGSARFVAEVAAYDSVAGGVRIVSTAEAPELLARMPVRLLPMPAQMRATWLALGLHTLGHVAQIEADQIADRFGDEGLRLWRLAHGIDDRPLVPRVQLDVVDETMTFAEPMGDLLVLQRAVAVLVERGLTRPHFQNYAPRTVTVIARLVSDASWRSHRVLRQPTVDAERVALTAITDLERIPAPAEQLCVRFDNCVPRVAEQDELREGVATRQSEQRERMRRGVRHVQSVLDDEAVLTVLEVAPGSRVPERRALLVPADAGSRRLQ